MLCIMQMPEIIKLHCIPLSPEIYQRIIYCTIITIKLKFIPNNFVH